MIKLIKENILGIAAIAFLVNGMSIVYMIRYTSLMLTKIALTVGILDSICAFVLLVIIGVSYTKKLFLNDDEN